MGQAEAQTAELPTAAEILDASAPTAKPVAEVPKPDERVSPKLQMLFQREKAAVQRERAAKQREAELESKSKAFADREARLEEFERIKQTNPRRALELLGLSYEDLTKAEMNDGVITPDIQVRKLESRLDNYVKSQDEALLREADNAKRESEKKNQDTLAAFKGEIEKFVSDNPRYELIAFDGAKDLVYDTVDEHFERTRLAKVKEAEEQGLDVSDISGDVLTIAEAADKVEAYLEKKYERAPEIKKIQSFYGRHMASQKKPAVQVERPPEPNRISHTPKTLTNQLSATPTPPRKSPVTDDERVAKAIAYARGLRPNLA